MPDINDGLRKGNDKTCPFQWIENLWQHWCHKTNGHDGLHACNDGATHAR